MLFRIYPRFGLSTLNSFRKFSANITNRTTQATGAKGVLPFVDDAETYDTTKEYPRFSLDQFYSSLEDFKITDEEALKYMKFAAKMSCFKFKSEQEMLSFKGDLQAALAFIGKLDDVNVDGVEPCGNVFEYYKGNESNMRSEVDF